MRYYEIVTIVQYENENENENVYPASALVTN